MAIMLDCRFWLHLLKNKWQCTKGCRDSTDVRVGKVSPNLRPNHLPMLYFHYSYGGDNSNNNSHNIRRSKMAEE